MFLKEENDVSDFIVKHGKDKMVELLKTATTVEEGFKTHLGVTFSKEKESYPQATHRPIAETFSGEVQDWIGKAKQVDFTTLAAFDKQGNIECR